MVCRRGMEDGLYREYRRGRATGFGPETPGIVRMERGIGEFVVEGMPLVSVAGPGRSDDETAADLNDVCVISRQRTVQQDAGFGIRQIVEASSGVSGNGSAKSHHFAAGRDGRFGSRRRGAHGRADGGCGDVSRIRIG